MVAVLMRVADRLQAQAEACEAAAASAQSALARHRRIGKAEGLRAAADAIRKAALRESI